MPTPTRFSRRAISRGLANAGLLGLLFAATAPLHAADKIEDRNGVVLFTPGEGPHPGAFPYRALAAQVLTSLPGTPEPGGVRKLSLDASVQTIAEDALRAVHRGAAVVLDPQSGEILAMASVPSFDPNTLTAQERFRLAGDPTEPLANRAVQSFAPGSIFKLVTALAGARKGLTGQTYTCSGGVTYGDKFMKCWIAEKGGSHGAQAMDEALKNSCNPYFYQYGNAAGIQEIGAVSKLLGLGALSGLPLAGEAPGIIPGPEWLRGTSPNERWSHGYTANTSIGQGFVLASPLEMARVAAALGNAGRIPPLRLILDAPAAPAVDLREHGVSADALEIIQRGMRKVVTEGTGQRAEVPGIEVTGKTGTAQYWRDGQRDNHTWFVATARTAEKQLAVCILVQGGKTGGGVAAPLAARIIKQVFQPKLPAPRAFDSAKGSFEQIDQVSD